MPKKNFKKLKSVGQVHGGQSSIHLESIRTPPKSTLKDLIPVAIVTVVKLTVAMATVVIATVAMRTVAIAMVGLE